MKKTFAFFFLLTAMVSQAASNSGYPVIVPFPITEDPCAVQSEKTVIEYGTVKWYNDVKGFGFIGREKGADLFVHHSSINYQGYRTLTANERVSFEVVKRNQGLQAGNVIKLK